MTLKEVREIIERCKTLDIYEERLTSDNYYEFVFYTKDTKKWDSLIESALGAAVKPTGEEPGEEHVELTKKYGGVRGNQVLYGKQFGDTIVIAMFWPWQDEVRTTLKIAFIKQ